MKTKIKCGIFIAALFLAIQMLTGESSAATTLPDAQNGEVTLNEDVTLSAKYVVPDGTTLKIDLNGNTLTGPNDNYTIENIGNLTIVDSKGTGKIVGIAPSSSCVRNLGTLHVNGVTIESSYIAIKNDATNKGNSDNPTDKDMYGVLDVQNSKLSTTCDKSGMGTVFNWATATIKKSTVTGPNIVLYVTSGGAVAKNSDITVQDCRLEGKYVVYAKRYDSKDTTTQTIKVIGGTVVSSVPSPMYLAKNTGTLELEGTITGPIGLIPNSTNHATFKTGTKLILNKDVSNTDIVIPEGTTLSIPENINYVISGNRKLQNLGTIEGKFQNANVYNETKKIYYATLAKAMKVGETNGSTIKLLNDREEEAVSIYSKYIATIDLNGYKFTGAMNFTTNSDVTILDSSKAQTGKVEGTMATQGTLKIQSGTYSEDVTQYLAEGSTIKKISDTEYKVGLKATELNIKENLELTVGDKSNLSATYKPETTIEEISYKSSNEDVVTVDEKGNIEAKKVGTAEITVTIGDIIKKCTVTVKAKEINSELPTIGTDTNKDFELGVPEESKQEVQEILKEEAKKQEEVTKKLEEGKQITVEVKMDKAEDTIAQEDKNKLNSFIDSKEKVGQLFDISLIIKADSEEIGKLEELSKKLELSVTISQDLIKEGRIFYIVRIHDGKVERLATTVEGNIAKFKTDKFSTYALTYTDKEELPVTPEEPKQDEIKNDDQQQQEEKKDETSLPKTGDIVLEAWGAIALIAIIGLAVTRYKKVAKHSK